MMWADYRITKLPPQQEVLTTHARATRSCPHGTSVQLHVMKGRGYRGGLQCSLQIELNSKAQHSRMTLTGRNLIILAPRNRKLPNVGLSLPPR
jgi:hypothetical protein